MFDCGTSNIFFYENEFCICVGLIFFVFCVSVTVFVCVCVCVLSSPPELQFYTSAAAVIMLIPAWVFLLVSRAL